MTQDPPKPPPAADLPEVDEKQSRFSIVWLIPILAAALGGWLFYKHLTEAGIPISLTFETASGLEAGKTKIMFRAVQIGLVDTIEVGPDDEQVLVKATLDRQNERYLRGSTRFWVVRPRITTSGVEGLGTLLSGAYITLEPGDGKASYAFTGLESPPPLAADTPGRRFTLRARNIGSIGEGSPIYYHGIRAGEVLTYDFDAKHGDIKAEIFIHAPYHEFVLETTQFWNASGIEVDVGAEGMSLRTESLEALLIGGIAFRTPKLGKNSPQAEAEHVFTLHKNEKAIDRQFNVKRRYVMYFEGSVRGLSVGAPVEFLGLQIGEVTAIDVEQSGDGLSVLIPVTVLYEPERLLGVKIVSDEAAKGNLEKLIDRGLRAQLKTGSIITGQLYVDLVMQPDTEVKLVHGKSPHLEVPTIPSDFAALTHSVKNIIRKIDELPFERIGKRTADAIDGIATLTESPDLKDAIKTANATLKNLQKLLKDVDGQVGPLAKGADDTMSDLRKALAGATKTLAEASRALVVIEGAVGKDSAMRVELVNMLREAAAAARSFRQLTNFLERHPEALLKGKPGSGGK